MFGESPEVDNDGDERMESGTSHLRPSPHLSELAEQMLREGADLPAANPSHSYAPSRSSVGTEARSINVNAV